MEAVRKLLGNYPGDVDDRVPSLLVDLPYLGTIGFVGISHMFWLQSFLLLCFQSVINMSVAVLVYVFIVKRQGELQKYLIGYGIICPLLLVLPVYLINLLELKNIAFMLCLAGAMPNLLLLRVMGSIHSTLPSYASETLGSFVLYYSSTLQYKFDAKSGSPLPLNRRAFLAKFYQFLSVLLQSSLLYSLLLPFNYMIFPRRDSKSLTDLYYVGNILNSFLMASLTSLVIEGGATGLGLLTSIVSGMQLVDFSDSPLTKSVSPSDFWGNRWDKPVASALKDGVFRPLHQAGFSRHIAAIATFVVSGVIHEYVLYLMAQREGHANNPTRQQYTPNYGRHTQFFLWNGIVLLFERALETHRFVKWIKANIPGPLRTALVLMTVLPIAHFFTDEYIKSGFYSDASLGFPLIVYLGK